MLICALQSRGVTDVVLKPAIVVFRYSSLTSVAAIKSNSWIVLFVGTETGLLIKVSHSFTDFMAVNRPSGTVVEIFYIVT